MGTETMYVYNNMTYDAYALCTWGFVLFTIKSLQMFSDDKNVWNYSISYLHGMWNTVIYWPIGLDYIDGLVQERRNSIVNALELRLSCTNPSIYSASI